MTGLILGVGWTGSTILSVWIVGETFGRGLCGVGRPSHNRVRGLSDGWLLWGCEVIGRILRMIESIVVPMAREEEAKKAKLGKTKPIWRVDEVELTCPGCAKWVG